MSLDQQFETAVKALTKRPSYNELLELYALFKQATVGDNPSYIFYSFVEDFNGKAKWDAWNTKRGISQEVAKQSYIDYANELISKYT